MGAARVTIALTASGDGWLATVSVDDATATVHRVRISRAELERYCGVREAHTPADERSEYGGGDVTALLRRSFEFLLAREPNTSILREFSLADIERYFPEFPKTIRGA